MAVSAILRMARTSVRRDVSARNKYDIWRFDSFLKQRTSHKSSRFISQELVCDLKLSVHVSNFTSINNRSTCKATEFGRFDRIRLPGESKYLYDSLRHNKSNSTVGFYRHSTSSCHFVWGLNIWRTQFYLRSKVVLCQFRPWFISHFLFSKRFEKTKYQFLRTNSTDAHLHHDESPCPTTGRGSSMLCTNQLPSSKGSY